MQELGVKGLRDEVDGQQVQAKEWEITAPTRGGTMPAQPILDLSERAKHERKPVKTTTFKRETGAEMT